VDIDFKRWCDRHTDLTELSKHLNSSVPEEYIGFYIEKIFDDLEYHKKFNWLGRCSLDFFVPSLELAIEYDGLYSHEHKKYEDEQKDELCIEHDITVIRVRESKYGKKDTYAGRNSLQYYPIASYANVGSAIELLCSKINELYRKSINIDVNLNRDQTEILSYVQNKHYKRSIAYVWPESKDYWDTEMNGLLTVYDVFYTDGNQDNRVLKCPHCGRRFRYAMRGHSHRKSLRPCEFCEIPVIEKKLKEAEQDYLKNKRLVVFDESLDSRRLYDRMISGLRYGLWGKNRNDEERQLLKQMYQDLGFQDFF